MVFTRFSDTVLHKSDKRVVSITVTPTITDCSGSIWFTDLQIQEGDQNTGYATHTSRALLKFRKNGVIQPPRHFNGIVRSGDTVVLANTSIVPSGNSVIIDKTPQVSAALDCYVYPVQAMEAGCIMLATGEGDGAHRCLFVSSAGAGDEFSLLASRRQCLRNGSATPKRGFYQYVAFGDNKQVVKLEENKSARLLFEFQQMVEGGERF